MRRHALLFFVLAIFGLSSNALAQQAVVAPSRSIDWSKAGVTGGVPNRTVICFSFSPGATAAQINSAIASCPSGQVVYLSPGTYNLSSGLVFSRKNNVTLRGAGPNQTSLVFAAGVACNNRTAAVCFLGGDGTDGGNPSNISNWTSGFAPGTTSITLGPELVGAQKPAVGSLLILDQVVDGTARSADTFPEVFQCITYVECIQGDSTQAGGPGKPLDNRGSGASGRAQFQIVTVTSISSGNAPWTVGISPSLYMPNWSASQSPQAWWSGLPPVSGDGLESVSLDFPATTAAQSVIGMTWAANDWVKNVRSNIAATQVMPERHVEPFIAVHFTIRDSYFFGDGVNTDVYGLDCFTCNDGLVENNIYHHIRGPIVNEMAAGMVFAYNYFINNHDDSGWRQPAIGNHGSGANYWLLEGNDGFGFEPENYWGLGHFLTAFRNRFVGHDPVANNQTVPIMLYGLGRFLNIIGNVLGESGYHTHYQTVANDGNSNTYCNNSVYMLGLGWNCTHGDGVSSPLDDPHTLDTLFRWGNWDVVTNAVRWCGNSGDTGWSTTCGGVSEVPTGLSKYAQAVPPTETLPPSLYLPGRPGWWSMPTGAPPWPPIGPDVTNGTVSGTGGHVYRIPARICFEDMMGGLWGDTVARSFNAASCYPINAGAQPPAAPTNLRITG